MSIRLLSNLKFQIDGSEIEYDTRKDAEIALSALKKLSKQRRTVRKLRGKPLNDPRYNK